MFIKYFFFPSPQFQNQFSNWQSILFFGCIVTRIHKNQNCECWRHSCRRQINLIKMFVRHLFWTTGKNWIHFVFIARNEMNVAKRKKKEHMPHQKWGGNLRRKVHYVSFGYSKRNIIMQSWCLSVSSCTQKQSSIHSTHTHRSQSLLCAAFRSKWQHVACLTLVSFIFCLYRYRAQPCTQYLLSISLRQQIPAKVIET